MCNPWLRSTFKTPNIGTVDRNARIAIGLALLALGFE
jgi:hypothetical protein